MQRLAVCRPISKFQLTAARRRLGLKAHELTHEEIISTHSRAKAAGYFIYVGGAEMINFNSQPREGGWTRLSRNRARLRYFNSQPREGGWPISSQTEKAV